MPAIFPNQRCVCGYTRFRESRPLVVSSVERWMLFEGTEEAGFGATPFGTFFGAGSGGTWGLFEGTLRTTTLQVACERCQRPRRTTRLGSVAIFGSYIEGDALYMVASDLLRPVSCYSVRFVGEDGETYTAPVTWVPLVPPPILVSEEPEETADSPPAGAGTVSAVLYAPIPEVLSTQEYEIVLVDACASIDYTIATTTLEAPPMIFTPLDADIGAAPRAWLRGTHGRLDSAQYASGSRRSIPFDKCSGVIEYDPELGTLPEDQDFTHAGSGSPSDYSLVPGGALQQATAAGLPSYWTKEISLPANPGQMYVCARALTVVDVGHSGATDGFLIGGRYARSIGAPYAGVFAAQSVHSWYMVENDLSAATAVPYTSTMGWSAFAVSINDDVAVDQYWFGDEVQGFGAAATTTGSAAAFVGQGFFGDYAGVGDQHLLHHYCASFGGRFIRARFTGITPVAEPVLRIYGMADANASSTKTVRFRVRYGVATADPYARPTGEVEATVNALTANIVYEIPLQLTGLTAKAPLVFTLERVWDHADDQLEATFHVTHVSLRSS